jgi:transposase
MGTAAVGIDIGEERSETTYLSAEGDVIDRFSFPMNPEGYAEFARRIPAGTRIAFEASGMAYSVSKTLKGLGYPDLTVAHPKELAWIVKSKKKNDKVDSLKLAKLHLVNMLPESHLLSDEDRTFRDLLVQRVRLGKEISSQKNSIIGYLKREDKFSRLPESTDNFSETRREAMKTIAFGDAKDLVLKGMFERLEFYEKQCEPLEVRIKASARESEDVKLLMSIPGVGYYLASLLSSYIGDIQRFPSHNHLASFFGVVPTQRDSSSIKRRGKMSKEGNSTARWALSTAVDTVMCHNLSMRAYYEAVKNRTKSGKLAHVLTMRKLVRRIDHMLRTREAWKRGNVELTERKIAQLEA